MKRFSKYSAATITIAILLFLTWLIVKTAGGNSLAVNILGIITVFFCVISLLTIPKDVKVPEDANIKDWDKMVIRSFPLLITLVLVTYFLEVTLKITWFPEAIVAYGTLFLAYATYRLGQTTIKENKIMREDNERVRKEERERESIKRRIEEVQEWIEGALGIQSKYAIPTMGKLFAEDFRAEALDTTSVYAMLEAHLLDVLIDNLRQKDAKETIYVYVETNLETLVKHIVTLLTEQAKDSNNPRKNESEIRKDCEVALAKLSELKAKLNL